MGLGWDVEKIILRQTIQYKSVICGMNVFVEIYGDNYLVLLVMMRLMAYTEQWSMANIAIGPTFSVKGVGADLQMIWISGDSAQLAVIQIISLYISLDIKLKF